MSSTFFVQECPTCGRHLQIRLELLGRQIACPQCEAPIEACDSIANSSRPHDSAELLLRAEELLATADARKNHPK
jgi:hypothetical protein